MAFTYSIGKGLKEPCSPNRELVIFGAELNPDTSSLEEWNCAPAILNATTSFNLSSITLSHEVVAAFVKFPISYGETYYFSFKWYRDRDNKLLFNYSTSLTSFTTGIAWCLSYIGYLDWEIIENGSYHVDIEVENGQSDSHTFNFTVSGIPEVEVPPELPLDWLITIRQYVNTAALWFKWVRDEVNGWVYPFSLLSSPFDNFYRTFYWIASLLTDAHTWAGTIAQMVSQGISWELVWSYILQRFPKLEELRDWFSYWWTWVDQRVTNWWAETKTGVISWINAAKDWAWLWIEYLEGRVNGLQVAWDSFVTTTLPTLPNWLDIDELIKSWFTNLSPLWEGWQDWRDKVAEFFSDPEQWLYDRIDSFFERYW